MEETEVPARLKGLHWSGEIPPQKWTQIYTKAISRFVLDKDLRIRLTVGVEIEGPISAAKAGEMGMGLRELGLNDEIKKEEA